MSNLFGALIMIPTICVERGIQQRADKNVVMEKKGIQNTGKGMGKVSANSVYFFASALQTASRRKKQHSQCFAARGSVGQYWGQRGRSHYFKGVEPKSLFSARLWERYRNSDIFSYCCTAMIHIRSLSERNCSVITVERFCAGGGCIVTTTTANIYKRLFFPLSRFRSPFLPSLYLITLRSSIAYILIISLFFPPNFPPVCLDSLKSSRALIFSICLPSIIETPSLSTNIWRTT